MECFARSKIQLLVSIEGATPEEIHRGGLAAMALFHEAGGSPLRAAEASFAREGWDLSGFDDVGGIHGGGFGVAHLLDEAAVKAAEVACADWV